MVVVDNTPPPPPPTADKLILFSITNKVPVKLRLEKYNYNSWSSLFKIHLGSLGLKFHVEEEASPKQVVSTLGNAKELWDHLQGLFHDNKDARAISLDNELRSIKIGMMSINDYCTKIKSMADMLKNIGSSISEKNLVIYAVNGLD
ncbi:hypothetical protein CTI12_AA178870 [Artemisia annua]|uniref:Hybrid signal transduction histidine kinase M n=1 Tax=Artemisia annua TaxID=35608 RepID=A0A2U1P908_ARTAN|nr:hypothetical protein CTI12_AA178870 [Artemisia annua]